MFRDDRQMTEWKDALTPYGEVVRWRRRFWALVVLDILVGIAIVVLIK